MHFAGKCRHYEDECHITDCENVKLKRQEAERQKTQTASKNSENEDKGGKGAGKRGGGGLASHERRRSVQKKDKRGLQGINPEP